MITQTTRPTKSELFTVYNKIRAAARRAGDTKQVERLNKALGILQSNAYYEGDRAGYLPTVEWCGCKDWQYREAKRRAYTGPCKHMLAERMAYEVSRVRAAHNITRLVEMRESRHVLESENRF